MRREKFKNLSLMIGLFTVASSVSGEEPEKPKVAEWTQIRAEAERELRRAETTLVVGERAADRFRALRTVLHHASGYPVLPEQIERLLIRASADRDEEIADLAERALFLRQHPPEREPGTDEEIRARQTGRELREIEEALTRRDDSRPPGSAARAAIRRLAHYATQNLGWSPDIERLVGLARDHDELEVARIAEQLLAKREGRDVDPAFALPENPDAATERRAEEEALFALARAESADVRLGALHRLMDRALDDGVDPKMRFRVREQMIVAQSDSDPRVAGYAGFMLAGLDGDTNALRMIYLGVPR